MGAKVSKDIKVAMLAIHLKVSRYLCGCFFGWNVSYLPKFLQMEEEAERILIRCGQYELLNKFYQVKKKMPDNKYSKLKLK